MVFANSTFFVCGTSELEEPVAQWVKCWPADLVAPNLSPARGKFFSTLNGVPLHTAFHYQTLIILIELKYY